MGIPATTSAVPNEPQPSNEPSYDPAQSVPLPKGYTLPSSRKGLTVNLQDVVGRTRLHRAVIDGSVDEVKELLSTGAAVNISDHEGNEPLHYAAAGESETIVQLLLDFGSQIDAKGNSGRTPLHMSLQSLKILETFLKARPTTSIQDDKGDTPLHLALSAYSLSSHPWHSAAIRLLDSGADVNILNAAGTTPFHLILNQPQSDSGTSNGWMNLFLDNGADIFLRTRDGQLPFSVYLDHSKSYWTTSNYNGSDPKYRNTVLKKFLVNGADPDTRLKSGEMLLHHSLQENIVCDYKDWQLGLLLCQKADISNPGASGNFPLHEIVRCVQKGSSHAQDFIRVLVRRLADPNQLNREGLTPLTLLLSNKSNYITQAVETVHTLLKAGADPLQQSLTGAFPLHLALRQSKDAVPLGLAEALLTAALEYDPAKRAVYQPGQLPRDVQWWHDWSAISNALDWATTKKNHLSLESVLDKDIREAVSKIAMKLTAQRCLDATTIDYEDLKKQSGASDAQVRIKQNQIVAILRDCRDLEIEVELKYFKYLLNFID